MHNDELQGKACIISILDIIVKSLNLDLHWDIAKR